MTTFVTHELGPQWRVHTCRTSKFKTIRIKWYWRRPLAAESAAATALLPMVLRRGSAVMPTSRELAMHLEQMYGAQFSVDVAKIGETHLIEWDMEIPDPSYVADRPPLLAAALAFLRSTAFDPLLADGLFNAKYFATERVDLRRRIEGMINDKPSYAVHRLFEVMCEGEPFAISRNGSLEAVLALTIRELSEHYHRMQTEAVFDMFIVGDVDPQAVAEMAAGWLGSHDRHPIDIPPPQRLPARTVRHANEYAVADQAVLAMGMRCGVDYASQAYPALLVYNGILGAYPHSKLFVNVRERRSLAYFVDSRLEATKGLQYIVAGINGRHRQTVSDLIQEQIAALKSGDFSRQELAAAQKSIISGFHSVGDDSGYIIDAHLMGLINGRQWTTEDLVAAVQSVTPDDVMRAAATTSLDTVFFLNGTAGKERSDDN